MRLRERRAGFTLIEVLVAIAVLAAAGLGWATLVGQTVVSLRAVHRQERELEAAARLVRQLEAIPGEQLEGMAGRRRIGAFTVRVSVEGPGLVGIDVLDADRDITLLSTHLYRPEERREDL